MVLLSSIIAAAVLLVFYVPSWKEKLVTTFATAKFDSTASNDSTIERLPPTVETIRNTLAAIQTELEKDSPSSTHLALLDLLGNQELDRELYRKLRDKVSFMLLVQEPGDPVAPTSMITNLVHIYRSDLEGLFPVLCQKRSFFERIVKYNDPRFGGVVPPHVMVRDHAPTELRCDAALMLQMCRVDRQCLPFVASGIGRNREFLQELLAYNPWALGYVSHDAQRLYPDLVVATLGPLFRRRVKWDAVRQIAKRIAPELWEDRDVVLQWFRSGFPFLYGFDPFRKLEKDPEIFLLVAKHSPWALYTFVRASPTLRGNKEFMMQVVKYEASLLSSAPILLQQDFDLALIAFAAEDRHTVEAYLNTQTYYFTEQPCNPTDRRRFAWQLHGQVQNRLKVHETFCSTLLCGMLCSSGSALTALDQGTETSLAYKKTIAAFLDVPTGNKLRLLRRADSNLTEILGPLSRGESGAAGRIKKMEMNLQGHDCKFNINVFD